MVELRVFSLGAAEGIPSYIYIVLIAIFCIGAAFLLWHKGWKEASRYCAAILLAEWVFLVIGTSVIFRESGDDYRIRLLPLISYFEQGENSYFMEAAALNILNVSLFIPVGLLLGCGYKNMTWRRAMGIGVLLSVSIEILQLIFKRGLCETDDVIHNVAGCMMGYGVYRLASKIIKYV